VLRPTDSRCGGPKCGTTKPRCRRAARQACVISNAMVDQERGRMRFEKLDCALTRWASARSAQTEAATHAHFPTNWTTPHALQSFLFTCSPAFQLRCNNGPPRQLQLRVSMRAMAPLGRRQRYSSEAPTSTAMLFLNTQSNTCEHPAAQPPSTKRDWTN
jgi:hypothetical protein